MHFIKCQTDQLLALRKHLDHEDLFDIILDGLDEDYKSIAYIVHVHDTPILFDELHEKLINRELALKHPQSDNFLFPITDYITSRHPTVRTPPPPPHPSHFRYTEDHHASSSSASPPTPQPTSQQQSLSYLGNCQGCLTVCHSINQCHLYHLVSTSSSLAPHTYQLGPPRLHSISSGPLRLMPLYLRHHHYGFLTLVPLIISPSTSTTLISILPVMVQMTLSLVRVLGYILHIQAPLPYLTFPIPLQIFYVFLT